MFCCWIGIGAHCCSDVEVVKVQAILNHQVLFGLSVGLVVWLLTMGAAHAWRTFKHIVNG